MNCKIVCINAFGSGCLLFLFFFFNNIKPPVLSLPSLLVVDDILARSAQTCSALMV